MQLGRGDKKGAARWKSGAQSTAKETSKKHENMKRQFFSL